MLAFFAFIAAVYVYKLLKYSVNGMLGRINDVANYLSHTSFKLFLFYTKVLVSIWFYLTYSYMTVSNASIKLV